jgi:tyrosyl-tRNA synthetase
VEGRTDLADPAAQAAFLTRNAAEVIPAEQLLEKLHAAASAGRPLRVKLGIDPSRPDLTLGHSVVLRKLREFQDLGHTAVLIVGDFTGLVGDPSGQSETRPMLTPGEMAENARTYFEQAGLVLDVDRAEVRRNSEWLGAMSMADVLRLTSVATVAQMLERDDFRDRFHAGKPISVVEFLYPLMQAMDSVAIQADVELGGTDQTFNLLMGREVQRANDQEPQVVFTMPLIEGLDGVRKMSKSLGNYVALTDAPEEMFGKLMSLPDGLIVKYLRLTTDVDPTEVDRIEAGLEEGSLHPADQKRRLGREIARLYHGAGAGEEAEARFDAVFRRGEIPGNVPTVLLPADAVTDGRVWVPRLLVSLGLATSNGDARRLVEGGAVRIGGEPMTDPDAELPVESLSGRVVQVGRRRFARVQVGEA